MAVWPLTVKVQTDDKYRERLIQQLSIIDSMLKFITTGNNTKQ